MTSFLAIERYSPVLVLLIGISTFLGLLGLGLTLLRLLRLWLPAPWRQVTAVLLGIQALSLTVQVAGMAGHSSRFVLSVIWWGLIFP